MLYKKRPYGLFRTIQNPDLNHVEFQNPNFLWHFQFLLKHCEQIYKIYIGAISFY